MNWIVLKGQQLPFIICNATPTMPSVLEVYWGFRGWKPWKQVDAVYLARYFKKVPGCTWLIVILSSHLLGAIRMSVKLSNVAQPVSAVVVGVSPQPTSEASIETASSTATSPCPNAIDHAGKDNNGKTCGENSKENKVNQVPSDTLQEMSIFD